VRTPLITKQGQEGLKLELDKLWRVELPGAIKKFLD